MYVDTGAFVVPSLSPSIRLSIMGTSRDTSSLEALWPLVTA